MLTMILCAICFLVGLAVGTVILAWNILDGIEKSSKAGITTDAGTTDKRQPKLGMLW